MKKLVLPLAILAMLALLGAAVAWDCARLAADARHRVSLADEDMAKHEERLVKTLSSYAKVSPMVEADLQAFQAAANPHDRRNCYDSLVVSFRKTMAGGVDPTNPLDRKFMDDVAGAINRREIAEKQYDEELAAYQSFLNSWRGRIAQLFTSAAKADSLP